MQAPPLAEVACPHCGGPASQEIFWSTQPGQSESVQKRQIRCASQPLKRRAFGMSRKPGCPVWQEVVEAPASFAPESVPSPVPAPPIDSHPGPELNPAPWVETTRPLPERRVGRRPPPPPRDPLEPALGLLSQLPDELLEDVARLARLHREARARLQALRAQLEAARTAQAQTS